MNVKCRWKRRKEARPDEILDAAREQFVEKGFAATRLDEIAARAGIAKGTLYLYFKNKESLFKALIQNDILPYLESEELQSDNFTGSVQERLSTLLQNWWTSVGETHRSSLLKLVISEADNFPELTKYYVDQVVRRSRQLFIRLLESGMEKGEFKRCNAVDAARILLSPLVLSAIWQHSLRQYDNDVYDPKALIKLHLDLFLDGIKNRET